MLETVFVITMMLLWIFLSTLFTAAFIYACNFIMKKLTGNSIADIIKYKLQFIKDVLKHLGLSRKDRVKVIKIKREVIKNVRKRD